MGVQLHHRFILGPARHTHIQVVHGVIFHLVIYRSNLPRCAPPLPQNPLGPNASDIFPNISISIAVISLFKRALIYHKAMGRHHIHPSGCLQPVGKCVHCPHSRVKGHLVCLLPVFIGYFICKCLRKLHTAPGEIPGQRLLYSLADGFLHLPRRLAGVDAPQTGLCHAVVISGTISLARPQMVLSPTGTAPEPCV